MTRVHDTMVVTGGTAGIGFFTARALAATGATVLVTGRDAARGHEAERALRAQARSERVHFVRGDTSTVRGNDALAEAIAQRTDSLAVLVNNVGGLYTDRWQTDDGYEATLAMNLVGPVALTEQLTPLLRRGGPARVVNVTSDAFTMTKHDLFADVHSTSHYLGLEVYARAKSLEILWTLALARRLEGTGTTVNCLNPGMAWTAMTEAMRPAIVPAWMRPVWPIFRWVQRRSSPERAARSSVHLATSTEAASLNGHYVGDDGRPRELPAAMRSEQAQERAWQLGHDLVQQARHARLANETPGADDSGRPRPSGAVKQLSRFERRVAGPEGPRRARRRATPGTRARRVDRGPLAPRARTSG